MISIIHPSRKRPDMALKTYTKWCNNSSTEIQYILSLDTDDSSYYNLPEYEGINLTIIRNENKNAVQAINNGAKISKGDILIVVSDDFECMNGWDKLVLNEAKRKSDFLLKTKDGIQDWIVTLPIMDRVYYNRFGYIYPPQYEHMFCDTELTCVAELTGRMISCNLMFKHNHYTRTGLKDSVSEKADRTWKKGQETFIERAKNKFGLNEITGRITDKKMINWLKANAKIDYSNPLAL